MVRSSAALALAALSALAAAKTDIGGCTYYDGVFTPSHGYPYATRIWYVDGTGELCEILDCGGGRAPPKTTVPGCDNYVGTATYEPRFIDPATLGDEPITTDIVGTVRGAGDSVTSTSEAAVSETTTSESATETSDDAEDTASITDVSTTAAPETGSRSETTPAATQTSSSAEETETGAPDSAAGVVGAKLGVAALGAFVAAAGFL